MAKLQLTLVLKVGYDTHGTKVSDLKELLEDVAIQALNRGNITGNTPAEVAGWSVD